MLLKLILKTFILAVFLIWLELMLLIKIRYQTIAQNLKNAQKKNLHSHLCSFKNLNSLKSDDLSFFNDIIFVSCITSYYCTLDERKFSLLLDNTFKLLFNIGGVGCKKLMHFAISVLMIIIVLWFTQSTSHTFTARSHYYFIDQFTH